MKRYYIQTQSGRQGPYSAEQLQSMLQNGNLDNHTSVCEENQQRLIPLQQVLEKSSPGYKPTFFQKHKTLILSLPIFLIISGYFITTHHVILGMGIPVPVKRDAFSFSEFIIDINKIRGMPAFMAQAQFPIGIRVLQREGILESNEQRERRIQKEAKEKVERWMRE